MKFVMLYKRPGHRVIINGQGDMLVRPSFIEMTLSRTTGAVNIAHHMLASYQRAFLAIARSQFNPDGLEGGVEEMLKISSTLQKVLGVSRARLVQELSWGGRIKELEKKKKNEEHRFKLIRRSLDFIIDGGSDLASLLKIRFQSIAKWIWTPTKRSKMEGIDPSKMQVCGTEVCKSKFILNLFNVVSLCNFIDLCCVLAMDMNLPQGTGGICCEVGNISSTLSQKTNSSSFDSTITEH